MLKIISTLIFILILLAVYKRKNTLFHARTMIFCFVVDVILVLYIEISRHVIEGTVNSPHPYVVTHALLSTPLLLLYGMQLRTGLKRLKGQELDKSHKKWGIVFVVLRAINLFSSYFIEYFMA